MPLLQPSSIWKLPRHALVLLGGLSALCMTASAADDTVVKAIEHIAPGSAVDPCVNDPKAPDECRTAAQAADPILNSFEKYEITNQIEKAALVALMGFETADFKYHRNYYPGRPGQGTRNMQMASYNKKYAASIPEVQDEFEKVQDDPDAVLDLLVACDNLDFASAAWFLTTQCSDSVRTQLQSGSEQGWNAYTSQCIGTTVTEERKAYMDRAREVADDL